MQPEKEHKRKYAVAVGGVFMLLAIIGAINVIFWCISTTSTLFDNQKQKTKIEEFLTPIVMFDPAPFSDVSEIENSRIIMYSMWTALSDEDQDFKRAEENEQLLVPEGAIDVAAYSIFRDKVKVKHETVLDISSDYFYNSDENVRSYEVNTGGYFYVYRPQVNTVKKNEDGTYDIEVEYISPENAWRTIFKGDVTDKVKKMTYVLEKVEGEWYLLAIRPQGNEGVYEGAEITGTTESVRTLGSSGAEEVQIATPRLEDIQAVRVGQALIDGQKTLPDDQGTDGDDGDGESSGDEDETDGEGIDGEEATDS